MYIYVIDIDIMYKHIYMYVYYIDISYMMFLYMPKMGPSLHPELSGEAASGIVHRKVHSMLLQLVICSS